MSADTRDLLDRWEECEARLSQPGAADDPGKYRVLLAQYRKLAPAAEAARGIETARSTIADAEALLADPDTDAELRTLAQEEIDAARAEEARLNEKLSVLLMPHDPKDDAPAVLEIRAGAGGEEAALFAAALFRMYRMYAARRGWEITVLSQNRTELGGIKELVCLVEGEAPFSRLKYESGVHRVQRVPDTETQGRIHTSTATVAVLPETQDVTVEINPNDLRIDTYRSSGAGGQHINKTESAIRITHIPTGLVVECQDERSQYKNKDKAMRVLRTRLQEAADARRSEEIAAERRSQVKAGDRSEKIRTYNFPQSRVTDHRIHLTLSKIDSIMDGDLDELIDALARAGQIETLQRISESE